MILIFFLILIRNNLDINELAGNEIIFDNSNIVDFEDSMDISSIQNKFANKLWDISKEALRTEIKLNSLATWVGDLMLKKETSIAALDLELLINQIGTYFFNNV